MRVFLLLCILLCLGLSEAQEDAQRPEYPTFDGYMNNADNPSWGKTFSPYSRAQVRQPAYGAVDALAGANRPSPRAITLALLNQPYFKATSAFNSSYLLTALGQLVAHDITRGGSSAASNGGPAPIMVPPKDPYYSWFSNQTPVAQQSRTSLPYIRTNFTRSRPDGVRQQVNEATAWLDASALYGENSQIARKFRVGAAGRLLDDGNRLLPFNIEPATGQPKHTLKNDAQRVPQTRLRFSGNLNVNQNPLVMSLVTVLMREHNRRAKQLEDANPDWGDDKIFNEARKWVIGHFQRITLVDYLAALGIALPPYQGYNASLDPSIDNFFTSVAYRYGHTTVNDMVMRLGEDWSIHPKGHLLLGRAYYNPDVILEAGLDPILRGLIMQPQAKVEPRWSLSVSGNFLGESTVNGTDLAAINIQRGRDHGIPDYNTCRKALGLRPVESFTDITPDAAISKTLKQLYGTPNNIDAYVGGLAEAPEGGSHLGPLFTASVREQFTRLRDADYWYYENGANNKLYNTSEIEEIRSTSLRDIILRNTGIKELPEDIWTAGGMGACSAELSKATGKGSRLRLRLPTLMGGAASLLIEPSERPGWVKVVLTSAGKGWLGFGVADAGSGSPMIGADMVIGRMADAKPQVSRFRADGHQPPTELPVDAQDDRLADAMFMQSNGNIRLEFMRPTEGDSKGPNMAMPVNGRLRIIVARGPSNDIRGLSGYHGSGPYRDIIELKEGLFGTASTIAADEKAVVKRKIHGVLMAVNFVVVFPLGSLAARQVRCHWLRSHVVRAGMFYAHIITQLIGIAVATAGFVLATRWFSVPYATVEYRHGQVGIATLALVYSQLLVGFLRPSASAPKWRNIWDLFHSIFGHAAILIGIANVAVGVVIFSQLYEGNFGMWAFLCGASLGLVSLLNFVLDRKEKYAVAKLQRKADMMAPDGPDDPNDHGKCAASGGFDGPEALNDSVSGTAYQDSHMKVGGEAAQPSEVSSHYARPPGSVGTGPQGQKLTATLLQQHEATGAANGFLTDVGALRDVNRP